MKKEKRKGFFSFGFGFSFGKVYRTESWEIRKEFMVPALFEKKMIRKVIGVYAGCDDRVTRGDAFRL